MKGGAVRRLSSLHKAVFKLTRGRVGGRLVDNDMLLLTTAGARTGRDHTVPLLFLRHDESLVVIASYGGREGHPQWYKNLMAKPVASVQVGSKSIEVEARTASGEERSRLWRSVVRAYDEYRVYQSRTNREFPIVILKPTVHAVLPLAPRLVPAHAARRSEVGERGPLGLCELKRWRETFSVRDSLVYDCADVRR